MLILGSGICDRTDAPVIDRPAYAIYPTELKQSDIVQTALELLPLETSGQSK